MLTELRGKNRWTQQELHKQLGNIKNEPVRVRNIITAMNNTLEGINSRLGDTEEHISKLEHRIVEISQSDSKKKKKNETILRDL